MAFPGDIAARLEIGINNSKIELGVFVLESGGKNETFVDCFRDNGVGVSEAAGVDSDNPSPFTTRSSGMEDVVGEEGRDGVDVFITWKTDIL